MNLLTLSGSLRSDSLNTLVLQTLSDVAADGITLRQHDYREVPLFDEDLDRPASVDALIEAIESSQGLIIATPEYNYSVPGVLKNAIDWASRPAYRSVFAGKPVAVVSASKSPIGGARAQQHLKTILLGMSARLYPAPEVALGMLHQRVEDGRITDERDLKNLRRLLDGFVEFVR